jgi:ParB-like chromosome segregation protein Spo0J
MPGNRARESDNGSNIEESVGVRQDGPTPTSTSAHGPYTGFTRLEGAGLIDIDLLEPDPTQPRQVFEESEIETLTDSIRKRGLMQPLRIRYIEGKHIVTVGARRLMAARLAGLSKVPVVLVEDEASPADILWERIAENSNRVDLSPLSPFTGVDAGASSRERLPQVIGGLTPQIQVWLLYLAS